MRDFWYIWYGFVWKDKKYIDKVVEKGGKGVKKGGIENENYLLDYWRNRL